MTILQDILAAAGWQTRVNENFRSVSPAGLYGINPATTTGLTLGLLGGEFNGVTVANGTVALTASSTNYVVAHRTTGAVTAATNTTNWLNTGTYMQLYQLVAGTSTFTIASTSDKRQAFGGTGSSGFTGGTLTSALNEAPAVTIASASTVNIGAAAANTISVSGTTTITAFDAIAASAVRRLVFGGALTLTHNGTSLILPTGANITTAAGDVAEFVSLGSGNWRCVNYMRASGAALSGGGGGSVAGADKQIQYNDGGSSFGAEAGFEYDKTTNTLTVPKANLSKGSDIASATTTDIGAATGNFVHITGTTTITGFGTVAAGAERVVVFDGALTLTHNGTSLILPTGANITTAAGDAAICVSEGSGNWRVTHYQRKDGSSLAGGGGGGLTNITEGLSTASPNATTNVASLTVSGGSANADFALSPKATGALTAHIADSATAGGNKRGAYATDWQRDRIANTQVASGASSTISGGRRNTASNSDASVSGGITNIASGSASTVCGGDTNTASGASSVVVGGTSNVASGDYSIAGGQICTASANHSSAFGNANTANGLYSLAIGRFSTGRSILGGFVHASGRIGGASDAQAGRYHLIKQTTDATPTALTAGAGTLSATTTVALPNDSAYFFSIGVVARVSGGATVAGWKIEGTIKRDSGAGTTALVGTPVVTALGAIGGSLSVAAVADTTNGSLNVQVTGIAAATIKWSALVDTVEVIN